LTSNGTLETSTGQLVQGWSAVNGTVNANGPVGNITIPTGSVTPAKATGTMSAAINLNSQATVGDSDATYSVPIQVYDSQGASHTLTATFTETATNTWNYSVTIPAADLKTGGTTTLATGTMTFDGNGNLLTPASTAPPVSVKIAGLADGASDQTISWNLFDSTGSSLVSQYAQTSGESNPQQDGYAAGQVTSVGISNGGLLVATYSNGQQSTVGQLAMASIANPNSLLSVGDNNLQASASTSAVALGAANTAGNGQIVGGSLEGSTADMATQFTNLLTYERSYQAASRVITTADQLLQETVDLIHP
jgi:flagellar hook protein FlgE